MADGIHPDREDRGLSGRQLVLMFLAGVAVCAVFFAAGFLVGYNERSSRAASTERVTPSAVIPPTVNAPPPAAPGTEKPAKTPAAENPVPSNPPASEATPPITPVSPAAAPGGATEGAFWVQVAASSARQEAERIIQELRGKGYPAAIESPAEAGANDHLFRVRVGPFVTHEEADATRDRLAHDGFKQSFIKH
jgi:DedD protein